VAADGTVNVPFAGSVPVAGKSPQQIERKICRRLAGKANQPQVMVRMIRNATSNVAVVGEVAQSVHIPLRRGDVVTVHFQPLSFTVLGATGKNEEINFEAQASRRRWRGPAACRMRGPMRARCSSSGSKSRGW